MRLVLAKACAEDSVSTAYASLTTKVVGTEWTRLVVSNSFNMSMPGCSTVRKAFLYVETEGAENATRSIDVDDFQLWDVTTPTNGSGGAAGTAGAAGAAATAGTAGHS